jgi:hypothetical protein
LKLNVKWIQGDQGPMLWFFRYFRQKMEIKFEFLTQSKS